MSKVEMFRNTLNLPQPPIYMSPIPSFRKCLCADKFSGGNPATQVVTTAAPGHDTEEAWHHVLGVGAHRVWSTHLEGLPSTCRSGRG